MRVVEGLDGREDALIEVFRAAFAASEGAGEGDRIAGLVRSIFESTSSEDLRVFSAEDGDSIVGAVAFTALLFPEDAQRVMLLSPMAVAPDRWKTGVGQGLITAALEALARDGVDIVVTYGDPAYYGQTGFLPITDGDVNPPLPLSMPHGWLGKRLNGGGKPAVNGPSVCVSAFRQAELW